MAGSIIEGEALELRFATRPRSRVLIRGGSGWIGQHLVKYCSHNGFEVASLGRTSLDMFSQGKVFRSYPANSQAALRNFAPELVIDCAFVTRQKLRSFGEKRFLEENLDLARGLESIAKLPSVQRVVYLSSGAAAGGKSENLVPGDYSYASLKRYAERLVLDLRERGDLETAEIWRVWSVAGTGNQNPEAFAFDNLLRQAKKKSIRVQARSEVWRRYVWLPELAEFLVSAEPVEPFPVLNTGGEKIEIRELARRIAERSGASLNFPPLNPHVQADHYYSDGTDWERVATFLNRKVTSLDRQIELLWNSSL